MTYSKRQLYALGEPLGDSITRKVCGRTIYGGGGGSGGGTTVTTQNIPDELKPLASAYTNKAINLAEEQWRPYTGQRFEDTNQTQQLGIGMAQNRALRGSQTVQNAEEALNLFQTSNPYEATANPYGNVGARVNPYGQITPGTNKYAGSNPYLDAAVSRAQGSIVDNFNNMTKPQTEAAMLNSGSFGNSGYQQLMQQQQRAAGQQLSDTASEMYMQDYGRQQGLDESRLGRDLGAQQFNSSQGQDWAGRDLQAQQFNAGMGQDFASRNDAARDQQIGRKLQAAGMAPTFGNEAYKDAAQLMNVGGIQQDQGQRNLDFGYQQFQDSENLPYKQLAGMSGVFGSNLGASSTTTSSGGGK